MNKLSKVFLLVPMFLIVAGCAQLAEGVISMGQEKPEGAPPGYFSFTRAGDRANKGDDEGAAFDYCDAAKLGHPEAKSYCIKYAFLAGRFNAMYVCKAEDFDINAKAICKEWWWGDKGHAQKLAGEYLKKVLAQQQRQAREKAELEEKKRQEALAKKVHEEALSKISNSSSLESEEF